jgi:hypothetical protein
MSIMLRRIPRLLVLVASLAGASTLRADFITFNGVGATGSGGSLGAVDVSATFTKSGTDLTVTLSSHTASLDPVQVLSGLVWDISGTVPSGTSLTSAVTGVNSALYTDATHSTKNADVSNVDLTGKLGWQYESDSTKPLLFVNNHQYQFGLGASGLGGVFGGLGNADDGIAGPGSPIDKTPDSNQLPLVMSTGTADSSVVFVIHNFAPAASTITNVEFMFGSAGSDNVSGLRAVPEPSSIALVAVGGAVGLAASRRRKRASA